MESEDSLHFIVGAEKRLDEVLGPAEALPLLRAAIKAGAEEAAVLDESRSVLWRYPETGTADSGKWLAPDRLERPLFLEGETVGHICLRSDREKSLQTVVAVLGDALNGMIQANLKRLLTTEIHTHVVASSYEELLEANRLLGISEQRYRELAESLEKQVQERTAELRQTYARMLQQEKLAAVGQLAAGMAHEINNPLGFMLSNLKTLERYLERILGMLDFCRHECEPALASSLRERLQMRWREMKLDPIQEDLKELLPQTIEGAQRVQKIVADLRGFSHIDNPGESLLDINAQIERTLTVMAPQFSRDTQIRRRFGELPPVSGNGALLCQVFMNIIRNAVQARPRELELQISTGTDQGQVVLRFVDNGPGIPDEIRPRIFEPFFTTRDVGQGMGLGLAIAHDAVTAMGGTVAAHNVAGKGTEILVTLPAVEQTHG